MISNVYESNCLGNWCMNMCMFLYILFLRTTSNHFTSICTNATSQPVQMDDVDYSTLPTSTTMRIFNCVTLTIWMDHFKLSMSLAHISHLEESCVFDISCWGQTWATFPQSFLVLFARASPMPRLSNEFLVWID